VCADDESIIFPVHNCVFKITTNSYNKYKLFSFAFYRNFYTVPTSFKKDFNNFKTSICIGSGYRVQTMNRCSPRKPINLFTVRRWNKIKKISVFPVIIIDSLRPWVSSVRNGGKVYENVTQLESTSTRVRHSRRVSYIVFRDNRWRTVRINTNYFHLLFIVIFTRFRCLLREILSILKHRLHRQWLSCLEGEKMFAKKIN